MDTSSALHATLSPEHGTRAHAEQYLLQRAYPLNDADGAFGLELASVLCAADAPLAVRQAAGVVLKQYVQERWSLALDAFLRRAQAAGVAEGAEALGPEPKHAIRMQLLKALGDAARKVRLLAAQVLSIVCTADFPDHFPELFPVLRTYLGTADAACVHGALKFLSELVQVELDENQLLVVAREFVPLLQAIISDTSASAHIQARCVLVFRQCLTSLYMVKDTYTTVVAEAIEHYLPPWLHAFEVLLDPAFFCTADWNLPAAWEVLGLRREMVRSLGVASHFHEAFGVRGTSLLHRALENLGALAPVFTRVELTADLIPPVPEDGDADVATDASALAMALMTLLSETFSSDPMRALLVQGGVGGEGAETPALAELLRLLPTFAQMTCDDEASWSEDADAFVSEDDEENLNVTLRTAAMDLTAQLLDTYPRPALRTCNALVSELAAAQPHSGWKVIEAFLMLLGAAHNEIEELLDCDANASILSLSRVFEVLVLPHLDNDATFLRGRCFVFASQFVETLPGDLARRMFAAALKVTQQDAPLPLQLSAVRAIRNYGNLSPDLTAPAAPALLRQLGALMLRVSGSTLVLVLDTVDALLGEGLDEATQRGLVEASLVTWRANTSDPQVEISIAALLETLVERVPDVTVACASQAAVEALGTAGDDAGLAASAAALMRTVLNTAPARALHDIDSFFAAAAAYLMRADDAEAVPSLLQCFTTLCQKRGDELLAWRDEQGTRALDVMLRVVERVLSLDESVWGMALGTLLVTLMVAAGAELHPILGALLEALAARLARAQTSSCILALLFPLAYLFAEYTDATIAQLSEMQLSGRCALEVVVAMWLREVTHVHGWFVQNVHVLGLTRLLDHWPMALEGVCVDGDALMEEDRASPRGPTDAGIITRSRARSLRYVQVPVAAKLVHVLLYEHEHAHSAAADGPRVQVEDDDGDDAWADDETLAERAMFSDFLGGGGLDDLYDWGMERDDSPHVDLPGCRHVTELDRRAHIAGVFQRYAAVDAPHVRAALAHLSPADRAALARIVQS